MRQLARHIKARLSRPSPLRSEPPHFLIIGAMKAGTTSLYEYLTDLRGAAPAANKELQYFTYLWNRKPIEWYHDRFPRDSDGTWPVTGEASPQYLFHPHAAERCASLFPDVRLIAVLRNPIDRAFSHYQYEVNRDREPLATFEAALEAEEARLDRMTPEEVDIRGNPAARWSYKARGHYAEQLARWLVHFDEDQLRVIETDELAANPTHVVGDLARWLGLEPPTRSEFGRTNEGSYSSPMSTATREQLRDYFEPHNRRLYAMIGRDFGWR